MLRQGNFGKQFWVSLFFALTLMAFSHESRANILDDLLFMPLQELLAQIGIGGGQPPDDEETEPRMVIIPEDGSSPSNPDCGLTPTSGNTATLGISKGGTQGFTVGFPQPFETDATVDVWITPLGSKVASVGKTRTAPKSRITLPVKAGTSSTPKFYVIGDAVGDAVMKSSQVVDERTSGDITYTGLTSQVYVWDVDVHDGIVDYNALNPSGHTNNVCYDQSNSPALSADMQVRTTCGKKAGAVASDGTSHQLIRVKSGGNGRVCFMVDDSQSHPQVPHEAYFGTVSDALNLGSTAEDLPMHFYQSSDGGHYWGFGAYTPPTDFFDSTSEERFVDVLISYQPPTVDQSGNPIAATVSTVRRKIAIRRPPVIFVHGLWSDKTLWDKVFLFPRPGWTLKAFSYLNSSSVSFNRAILNGEIETALAEARRGTNTQVGITSRSLASSQVDIVAHSMGGVITRATTELTDYMNASNFYKGKVRKAVFLASPHAGSQLANMLISLHTDFFHETAGSHEGKLQVLEYELRKTLGGDLHSGAVCDLAEGSVAMNYPGYSDVKTFSFTGANGAIGSLGLVGNAAAFIFPFVEFENYVTPYNFNHPNDSFVAVDSMTLNGAINSKNDVNLNHFKIARDSQVKEDVFRILDWDQAFPPAGSGTPAFTLGMPSNSTSEDGVPRPGVGRGFDPNLGEDIDAYAYRTQCESGRPMNQ